MDRDVYKAFSEGRIASVTVKNRLIRSATHEGLMAPDGKVTEGMLRLYKDLAEGGVGLIITGTTNIMPEGTCNGRLFDKEICLYEDAHIKEIAKIAEIVHSTDENCRIFVQLNHVGRQVTLDNHYADPVGPSLVPSPLLKKTCRMLSEEEINYITKCFSEAIVRVKQAGYDGVQLHAAHGYLLSSFLSPSTNRRNDRYGGSLKKRVRIIREIVSQAREKAGSFPILVKINCDDFIEGGINRTNFPELAREIARSGVDAIEVSGGMWDCLARTKKELGFSPLPIPEARTSINKPDEQSYFLKYVEDLSLNIPVILIGGNRNIERIEKILHQGRVDFIALSRPLICEPDLPNRWREGRGSQKADCISCNACLWSAKTAGIECLFKRSKGKWAIARKFIARDWRLFLE